MFFDVVASHDGIGNYLIDLPLKLLGYYRDVSICFNITRTLVTTAGSRNECVIRW
jgi:hypothetical protein